jgi:putative nucleotidyltransferase with HDIG domain
VNDGIVRIGLRQIKSVMYGVAVSGLLVPRLGGYQLNQGALFQHSMVVATTSRLLASTLHYPDPEEAYTGGLLHDIGKLLLDKYVEPHYQNMAAAIEKGATIIQAEEQFVGADHATIGGIVAELWSLPTALREAIRFHHAPTLSSQPRLAALVNFANILVLQSGIGLTPLGIPPLHSDLPLLLGLTAEDLGPLAFRLRPEIEHAGAQFQTNSQSSPMPVAQGSGLLARKELSQLK